MSRVQHLTVAAADADQRLDRWLKRQIPHLTQGRIEKACRKGEIRMDGARVKAADRLTAGAVIRIPPVPKPTHAPPATPKPAAKPISEAMVVKLRAAVIFRDDAVLAINKPPGLAVQGGSKTETHLDALAEALRFEADEPPRLVHRLDKDTSGVLIMARRRDVADALTRSFRHRQTEKRYWAAVAGVPSPMKGIIRWGLTKAASKSGEKMQLIHPDQIERDGQQARTDYAVIERLATRAAWVVFRPVTGRTHQIRAHAAGLGHPILGDGKYGKRHAENKGDGWGAGMGGISRKLHLHARSLQLSHPVSGKTLHLRAELPTHMAESWAHFGWMPADPDPDPFDEEG